MGKTLHLALKKQWFDMILSGEKKEDYREIKLHWASRLLATRDEMEWQVFEEMLDDMRDPFRRHNGPDDLMRYFNVSFKHFDFVRFVNGYRKDSREFTIPFSSVKIAQGREKWGACPGIFYFVIDCMG